MEHPLQITFRGLEPSDALKEAVETRVGKLDKFYDKIESCRVVVEAPHHHHQTGNVYHVRVRLTVPGEEIVVSRDPAKHTPHVDAYLAINDAFKETKRQLEDYVRRRRRQVKEHAESPRAVVARIFLDKGYGFLITPAGDEVYFHANSVLGGVFEKIEVGTEVRFAEEKGGKGPLASTVSPIGL